MEIRPALCGLAVKTVVGKVGVSVLDIWTCGHAIEPIYRKKSKQL